MKKEKSKFICQCNQIPRDVIEAAIVRGCKSVQKVAIATTAGAGQCGGTCQPEIQKIIDELKANSIDSDKKTQAKK
jgi:NAD(P)H-nitrite reductase large subunit